MKRGLWIYVLAIVAAEVLGVAVHAAAGAVMHALLILVMLAIYLRSEAAPRRQVLPVLALVPLLRLLSLALPSPDVPQIFWYALVGLPLLLAAVLAAWRLQIPAQALGLVGRFDRWQIAIALSGLPLALAAYWLLRPTPLVAAGNWAGLALAVPMLALFAGFTEEFIFRGLLLSVTRAGFGRTAAIVGSSLLFATMYAGAGSLGFLVLVGLAGLFFAYCVDRTGSLWGVTLAHSAMVIGLIVILPALFS